MKKLLIVFLVIGALLVVGASSAGTRMINGISDMIIASRDDGIEEIPKVELGTSYKLLSVDDFSVGLFYDEGEYASSVFKLDEPLKISDYSYFVVRYNFSNSIGAYNFPNLRLDLILDVLGNSSYLNIYDNYNGFELTGSEWYDSVAGIGGETYAYMINDEYVLSTDSCPQTITFVYMVNDSYIEKCNIYVDDVLINDLDISYAANVQLLYLYGLNNSVNITSACSVSFDKVDLFAFEKDYDGDISSLFKVDESDVTKYDISNLSTINDYSIINGQ